MAHHYAVSRAVIREAVKMLAAMGLVEARPRQGLRIRPGSAWQLLDPKILLWLEDHRFSPTFQRHLMELRMAVEPVAAALAASNATVQDLRALDDAYGRQIATYAGMDDLVETDISFHISMLNASGNPFYRQCCTAICVSVRSSHRFARRYGDNAPSLGPYQMILKTMEAGNSAGASRGMTLVIRNSLRRLNLAVTTPTVRSS